MVDKEFENKEIDTKTINSSLFSNANAKKLGMEKSIKLYEYSKDDYNFVIEVLDKLDNTNNKILKNKKGKLIELLKSTEISNMKKECNSYLRDIILKERFYIDVDDFPKHFVEENKDIFLLDVDISNHVKELYYYRGLTPISLLKYIDVFNRFPIDNFIDETFLEDLFVKDVGFGNINKLMKKYYDFFDYIIRSAKLQEFTYDYFREIDEKDVDIKFRKAVKKYYIGHPFFEEPKWIKSMNFKIVDRINSLEDLMNYDDNTIIKKIEQREIIDAFGIDNLRKLEEITSIFSSRQYSFKFFKDLAFEIYNYYVITLNSVFNNGKLSYQAFESRFALTLDFLRGENNNIDYDFIEGKFRKRHKKIFMDKNAPEELKKTFYNGFITPDFLFGHDEYIPYLIDKDLINTIRANMNISLISHTGYYRNLEFIPVFLQKHGREKLLKLLVKYGDILSDIWFVCSNIEDFEFLEECIKKAIYDKICHFNGKNDYDYSYLKNIKDFATKYPELFVDFSELENVDLFIKEELENKFYKGILLFEDIKKYPQLKELIKDKKLKVCFRASSVMLNVPDKNSEIIMFSSLEVIDVLGNEKFLKLCEKYGKHLNWLLAYLCKRLNVFKFLENGKMELNNYSYEEIDKYLEEILIKRIFDGEIDYSYIDAPEFLKEKHPELFLSDDAPEDLKKLFYKTDAAGLNFYHLKNHKEWLPYLKGKSIKTAVLKSNLRGEGLEEYFKIFGEDTATKLAIKKPETIYRMLGCDEDIELMKEWYDKTGRKFIPDHVVMENISIDEADKFLSNATKWNRLMKLDIYSKKRETREALLKIAYSFGVFDGDERGFNRLYNILTYVPKLLRGTGNYYLNLLDIQIDTLLIKMGNNNNSLEEKIEMFMRYATDEGVELTYPSKILRDVIELKEKGKLDIDLSKPIMSQIYKEDDGTRTLILNIVKYPKLSCDIKQFIESELSDTYKFLTPKKLHELFGGFKMEYNPEFREFLLDNLNKILFNNDYQTYVAAIQKQFNDIKVANSNRKLTLPLAISYVQQNKYIDVEVGNEGVAEVSAIAGYSQEDFEKLQRIYNYGKQRVFSSIPRIENQTENYSYEMLRLDDPLALAIGTLTDCCQEIGNVAESCMEHSMVDKNGRVFVVRDKEGNIISQSWVWRNKDVLCFDNIEIPNKAFARVDDKNKLAIEVYEIYKKAAKELIKKDEEVYQKLLEENKITEEQYEGLKLSKVTVGIGYNDIKEALRKNSKKDSSPSRPLLFKELIGLDKDLYTSDSEKQYVLEEINKDKVYNGKTYQVHNDLYEIYDDNNFAKKELSRLGKLELASNEYSDISDIDPIDEKLVSSIAELYDIKGDKTRIILSANFAIIYEEKDDIINIVDIFYNTKVENRNIKKIVAMQLRLALEQIKGNKEIDISNLEEKQKEIYNMAINLSEELDIEKGIKIK